MVIVCGWIFSQFLNCISLILQMHFLSVSQQYFSCFAKALFSHFLNSISLSFSLAFLSVNQLYLLGYWEWMTAAAAASKQRIFVLNTVCISFSSLIGFLSVSQLYFSQFLNCISLSFSTIFPWLLRVDGGRLCGGYPDCSVDRSHLLSIRDIIAVHRVDVCTAQVSVCETARHKETIRGWGFG